MAFPAMFSLPSMPSSGRVSQYPSPPPVGIKLTEKKRWSVKRVLLLVLTAVAGYDFCNEFALGGGSKGPAVQIAPGQSKPSWRERSLALLRIKSTRKQPPLPPAPAARTTVTITASTSHSITASVAGKAAPTTTDTASAATATTTTVVRLTPSRPPPSPVTAVSVKEAVLLNSPRRSSVSASQSVYNQASEDVSRSQRVATASSSGQSVARSLQGDLYRNESSSAATADTEADEEEEKSSTAASSQYGYPSHFSTGLSSPPFVQSARPWQSPSGFTQLVEA